MASDFVLPSGRVVQTQEPTYAAEVHAISEGFKSAEQFTIAKILAVVKDFTLEDYQKLDRPDGHALADEVNRIFEGRPKKEDVPLGNGSPPLSTASSLASSIEKPPGA